MLYHLSTAHLGPYSLWSDYSLPGEWHQDAFRSLVHRIVLRAIVEPSCMSGDLLVSETIGSELRLRYLPVMITRLLLSLKKANASQAYGWSLGEPTVYTTMRFAEHRGGVGTRDEIRLDTFASTHEGTRSQE